MAQIELRNATIRIVDGYANTAAVNDSPANGDSTIEIDTLGSADVITPGTRFTVVGSGVTHYVSAANANEVQEVTVDATSGNYTLTFDGETTGNIAFDATAAQVRAALEALSNIGSGNVSVTSPSAGVYEVEFIGDLAETNVAEMTATDVDLAGGGTSVDVLTLHAGGATWEITFTPSFTTAEGVPLDDAVITFGGHTLEAKLGDGNLTYNENREMEYRLDRGTLDTVREGDDQPMEVNLDAVWEFITASAGDATPTMEDAIKRRGKAANWVSADTDDPCAPYAVDIEIEHEPPCGDEEREIIILPSFRWESLEHNASDATISMTGRCNAKEAVVTRAA